MTLFRILRAAVWGWRDAGDEPRTRPTIRYRLRCWLRPSTAEREARALARAEALDHDELAGSYLRVDATGRVQRFDRHDQPIGGLRRRAEKAEAKAAILDRLVNEMDVNPLQKTVLSAVWRAYDDAYDVARELAKEANDE